MFLIIINPKLKIIWDFFYNYIKFCYVYKYVELRKLRIYITKLPHFANAKIDDNFLYKSKVEKLS